MSEDTEDSKVNGLTVDSLHKALNNRGYICDKRRVRSVYAALMTRPIGGFFAFGPPGVGKTWLFQLLADILGTKSFFQQVSPGTREEELMQDLLPDEDKKSGIKKELGVMPRAIKASHDGPVFLILDEWDKTRPTADAFLLDFLQNGRINYGDLDMQANLDNLYVGITLNDERDLNGPLQRRLPYLEFEPLHPSLVRQALIDSHSQHPYIEAATNLYVRCERSHMDKACTIQELRNLLDAINVLGEEADWDQLVRDHVTKDRDNHRMLKNAEDVDVDDWDEDEEDLTLDPSAYGEVNANGDISNTSATSLPSMAETKGYTERTTNEKTPDLAEAFAALQKSDDVYDFLTRREDPSDDPEHFGRVEVEGETITFDEPVPIGEWQQYEELFGGTGEIVFSADADRAHIEEIGDQLTITSYAEDEIIGRKGGIHVRWCRDETTEIIVPLHEIARFHELFLGTWLNDYAEYPISGSLPDKALAWLGDGCGSIEMDYKGYEVADPYFSGVFDEWMGDAIDYAEDSDIPRYKDMLSYAEKNAEEIIMDGDDMYVFFENLMFGFIGEKNDYFALSVRGPFDSDLETYLELWVPESRLFLKRKDVPTELSEMELIENHDMKIHKPSTRRSNPRPALRRIQDGVKTVYRDGKLQIGSQLKEHHITRTRAKYIMNQIDKTIDELAA